MRVQRHRRRLNQPNASSRGTRIPRAGDPFRWNIRMPPPVPGGGACVVARLEAARRRQSQAAARHRSAFARFPCGCRLRAGGSTAQIDPGSDDKECRGRRTARSIRRAGCGVASRALFRSTGIVVTDPHRVSLREVRMSAEHLSRPPSTATTMTTIRNHAPLRHQGCRTGCSRRMLLPAVDRSTANAACTPVPSSGENL